MAVDDVTLEVERKCLFEPLVVVLDHVGQLGELLLPPLDRVALARLEAIDEPVVDLSYHQ